MKASPQEYRLLFELNPNPMWIFDEHTLRFLAVNEAAVKLYGWSHEEFLRMTVKDIRPPKEVVTLVANLAAQRGSGITFVGERRHWKKDRTLLDVEVTISCVQFQGRDARLTMVNDVTARKEAEMTLQADLVAAKRLTDLGMLFARNSDLKPVLTAVVDAAMDISRADFGNIQLLDPASGDLKIVAQRGYPKWWIKFWDSVAEGKGTCGTALARGKRVIVEDVERSKIFIGKPALKMQRKAGVRAGHSTPLVSRSGKMLGVFSAHYKTARQPDERVLSLLDLLARQTSDLIDHAQTEEAVRAREKKYRKLFNHDLTGDFVATPDGTILLCNPAFAEIFGFASAKAVAGNSLTALYGGEGPWLAVVELLRHRKRSERQERKVWRCDGRPLHIIENLVGEFNRQGELLQIQGFVFDETERNRTQQELERLNATLEHRVAERTQELALANQRLQAVMDTALIGILTLDEQGVIRSANPAAARIFGYTPKEMVGADASWLVASPNQPQDESFLSHFLQSSWKQASGAIRDVLGRHKDGHAMILDFSLAEFPEPGDGRFVAMVRDITVRKRLERELLEVGERERQRLGHDLHDGLGQHLHALYYMASLLEKEMKTAAPEQAREAGRLVQQLEHGLELTRSLARGLQPVKPVPEGLRVALRELAERTRALYQVDCRFQCRTPVLIERYTAANHLYRIAQEAVNNAMKHGSPTRIRIHLADEAERIIVGVRDNGVGIRQQAARSPGMGLKVMQFRADAIRGLLAVHRHPQGGTEVVCSVTRQALIEQQER